MIHMSVDYMHQQIGHAPGHRVVGLLRMVHGEQELEDVHRNDDPAGPAVGLVRGAIVVSAATLDLGNLGEQGLAGGGESEAGHAAEGDGDDGGLGDAGGEAEGEVGGGGAGGVDAEDERAVDVGAEGPIAGEGEDVLQLEGRAEGVDEALGGDGEPRVPEALDIAARELNVVPVELLRAGGGLGEVPGLVDVVAEAVESVGALLDGVQGVQGAGAVEEGGVFAGTAGGGVAVDIGPGRKTLHGGGGGDGEGVKEGTGDRSLAVCYGVVGHPRSN